MPNLTAIDHIVLTVRNIPASVAFYQRLGLRGETFEAADGTTRWAVSGAGFKINLHPIEAPFAPHADVPAPGTADICLISESPLAEWVSELGSEILDGPVPRSGARGAMMSVYLRDPDRNLIEISHYV